ncbi:hypothetical protein FB446DRAFT_83379 [Lentinula raphanica]|nr:hypothetical protein FB446DRAFT_83379 [Lentinula raphanica]
MVRYGIILVLVAISVLQAQAAPVPNTKSVTPLSEGQPLEVHETNLEVRGFKKKFKDAYDRLRGKTGETQPRPESRRTESIHSASSVWRLGTRPKNPTGGLGAGLAQPDPPPAGESPAQKPPSSPPPYSLHPSPHPPSVPPSRATTPLPPTGNAEDTRSQSSRRLRPSTSNTKDDTGDTGSRASRKTRHHHRHSQKIEDQDGLKRVRSGSSRASNSKRLSTSRTGYQTHKPRRSSVSSYVSDVGNNRNGATSASSGRTMRRKPSTHSRKEKESSDPDLNGDSLSETVAKIHLADNTNTAGYVGSTVGVTSARPSTFTSPNPGTANPYANPAETSAFTAAAATLANDNSGIMGPFIRR